MKIQIRPLAALFTCLLPAVALAQEPIGPGLSPLPDLLILTGANNHDWQWTSRSLKSVFEEAGCFGEIVVSSDPPTMLADPDNVARFEGFVLDYNGPRWGEPAESNFVEAVRRGAGVTVIHAANNAFPGWTDYEKMVGIGWRKGAGHSRYHVFDAHVVDPYHPITAGMPTLSEHPDEIYHGLSHLHGVDLRVLMSAFSDEKFGGTGRAEPVALVLRFGEGHVFHTTLGHVWRGIPGTRSTFADVRFRHLVARGTEWAALRGDVTLPPVPHNRLAPAEANEGFALLFDGERAREWRGYGRTDFPAYGWFVENGALTHEEGAGGGDLISFDAWGDFEFRFDWMVREGGNSGVIYRVSEEEPASWMTGPEYQVLDDSVLGEDAGAAATTGAGALYALQAIAPRRPRPVGTWNEGRIRVEGTHVQHWLNGDKVVDFDFASDAGKEAVAASKFATMKQFGKNASGHIVLQDHGTFVAYRNLRIRSL